MDETNSVFALLKGLVESDPQFYYKGRFFNLSEKDLPLTAGLAFVRDQLRALKEAAKEAAEK